MEEELSFDLTNPAHLAEAIVLEKYKHLKKITSFQEIDWEGFDVLYDNVSLIAEGHDVFIFIL